jgi:hypothetical protein
MTRMRPPRLSLRRGQLAPDWHQVPVAVQRGAPTRTSYGGVCHAPGAEPEKSRGNGRSRKRCALCGPTASLRRLSGSSPAGTGGQFGLASTREGCCGHAQTSSRGRPKICHAPDHQWCRRGSQQQDHEHQTQSRWVPQPREFHDRDLFPLRRSRFITTLNAEGSKPVVPVKVGNWHSWNPPEGRG